jgi:hypothetical protein
MNDLNSQQPAEGNAAASIADEDLVFRVDYSVNANNDGTEVANYTHREGRDDTPTNYNYSFQLLPNAEDRQIYFRLSFDTDFSERFEIGHQLSPETAVQIGEAFIKAAQNLLPPAATSAMLNDNSAATTTTALDSE